MIPSDKIRVKRYSERASYEKEHLKNLLSKILYCNISFCIDGEVFSIPMNFVYMDDKIYIHGSGESRLINMLEKGKNVSLSFVYVRNVVNNNKLCNYSMDYASAVVFGHSYPISDPNEKLSFFVELGKKVDPSGYMNAAFPSESDLEKVSVIKIEIDEFSLKSRIGFQF